MRKYIDALKQFIAGVLIISALPALSQSVGIGTEKPHPSAKLDVSAVDKGLLIPRLTSLQREAIKDPAPGLLVYDLDEKDFKFFNGKSWYNMGVVGVTNNATARVIDSAWLLTGNSGTSPATNFFGTIDDQPVMFRTNNIPIGQFSRNGSVVFAKDDWPEGYTGNLAVNGYGRRFFWYTDLAAFRVGFADGTDWNEDSIGMYSIAAGYSPKARGDYSVAMGHMNVARGYGAVALGYTTTASGFSAPTALGYLTTASADYSTAMGYYSGASGTAATAMGYMTNATGNYSTSIGMFGHASGESSTAMGVATSAYALGSIASGNASYTQGAYSIAGGNTSAAHAIGSLAMGYIAISNGEYSSAIGYRVTSKAQGSMSIGSFNDVTDSPNPGVPASTDRLFQIGNGTSYYPGSNAFTVLRNGRVGIGTVSPRAPLSFPGTLGQKITLWDDGNMAGNNYGLGIQPGLLQIHTYTKSDDIAFGFGSSAMLNETMRIKGNGNVGIGTPSPSQKLHVVGNICATGSITTCSDIRYKTNLQSFDKPLSAIKSIKGFYYEWKVEEFPDMNFSTNRQIGFSAQEIEKLFPELVTTDDEGYKTVDYARMTPVLVEAIKEQQSQIEQLRRDLANLKKMVEKLSKE